MSIHTRLRELLDAVGSNPNRFAQEIGGTPAKYYKLLEGKSDPQYSTVTAILDKYPNVSAEWLLRGVGSMFNGDRKSNELVDLEAENRVLKNLLKEEMSRPKTEGTLDSPYVDREHASELLSSVIENNAIIRLVKYGIFGYTPGLN